MAKLLWKKARKPPPQARLWGRQSRSTSYKKDKQALRAARRNVCSDIFDFLIFFFWILKKFEIFQIILIFSEHFMIILILKYFQFFPNFKIFRKSENFWEIQKNLNKIQKFRKIPKDLKNSKKSQKYHYFRNFKKISKISINLKTFWIHQNL